MQRCIHGRTHKHARIHTRSHMCTRPQLHPAVHGWQAGAHREYPQLRFALLHTHLSRLVWPRLQACVRAAALPLWASALAWAHAQGAIATLLHWVRLCCCLDSQRAPQLEVWPPDMPHVCFCHPWPAAAGAAGTVRCICDQPSVRHGELLACTSCGVFQHAR